MTGQITHGLTRNRARPPVEYYSWSHMKQRCTCETDPKWTDYGGRGIRVCDAWLKSFEAFYAAVGPKPGPKHTLGRINNDGNYEPGNVRWETPLEQGQNKRNNILVTWNGETLPLAAWSRRVRLPYKTVWRRVKNLRWAPTHALGLE